jgi:predicted phage baseplate assembly protein
MPLTAPVIDDRDFDTIVSEARSLIPRYTREWTDHNESDPGITLVELFAWMTEMLIYRLNQVPELNYVKFLQLLGIELNPAQPAHVDLTFSISPTAPTPVVIVPMGTQVAVSGAAPPLVFETDRALNTLRAPVVAVRTFDSFSYARVEAQNDDPAATYYPFGRNAREGSALLLGFDSTGAFPSDQIDLAVFVPDGDPDLGSHSCDADLTPLPPPATVTWQFWHVNGEWRAVDLVRDDTRAFTRSGRVEFNGPGAEAGTTDLGLDAGDLYWVRALLERSSYELAPKLSSVLTNTVPATQAQTVRDEVVGSADGSVSQQLFLRNTPVVAGSLQLEVDEGLGFTVWEEVDDFFASGPDDDHYTLNRTTGQITFGDGKHGRIPVVANNRIGGNVVARVYRYGGGKRGNVGAGKVTEMQAAVPFVEKATNRLPALLGADEETLAAAKLRAPQELQSKGRAVTAADFEAIAKETPGANVKRAKPLPLVHPKFPDTFVPGVVTVIVVPETDAPNPMPNETTLQAVCAYLNAHRLLTTELYVAPPHYRKVRIEADVVVAPAFDLAAVKADLVQRLNAYLNPLTGGKTREGWDFGGDVYFSDIAQLIVTAPGVDRLDPNALLIWVDEDRFGPCEDVPIAASDLVYSDGHDIRVAYEAGG